MVMSFLLKDLLMSLTAGVIGAARLLGASLVARQLPSVILPILRTHDVQPFLIAPLNSSGVMLK